MAADREVLREYLASLGFHVDETSFRKFGLALDETTKRALGVGTAIVAAAAATAVFVEKMASGMEKLFYQSQRTGETAANLRAFGRAAEQSGISAERAEGSIANFAMTVRKNLGLKELFQGYTGQNFDQLGPVGAMLKLVKTLKDQFGTDENFGIGAAIAEQFGIGADALLDFENNYDKLEKDYLAQQKLVPKDFDKTVSDAREFENTLRRVGNAVSDLAVKLEADLLPYAQEFATWVEDMSKKLPGFAEKLAPAIKGFYGLFGEGPIALVREIGLAFTEVGRVLDQIIAKFDTLTGGRFFKLMSFLSSQGQSLGKRALAFLAGDEQAKAEAAIAAAHAGGPQTQPALPVASNAAAPAVTSKDAAGLFTKLEQAYGLPAGLLSKQYQAESSGGKGSMVSSKGALGPFQFLPATGADLGLTKRADFFDLGKSANAAAAYLFNLHETFGDWSKAIAAYNWGPGNLQKAIDAADADQTGGTEWQDLLPKETADYLDKLGNPGPLTGSELMTGPGAGGGGAASPAVTVSQETTINVVGSGNPAETAQAVAGSQSRVNGDLVRNLKGALR